MPSARSRYAFTVALGLTLLLLAGLPARAADHVVKATLEPAVVGVGETAVFTIEVQGTGLSSLSFRPDFELENLDIVGGPNQFDSIRFANGTLTRTFRESWQVRPRAAGKARVRALRVQLDDELIQMRDREITVQEAPTGQGEPAADSEPDDPFDRLLNNPFFRRPPPPSNQPVAFLRAELQPQRPYVGQQVLYTVYLYTRNDITSMAARELPTFHGFWVRDVPQPQHLPTEIVVLGGQRYARVPVVQKALFPLRPGHSTIEPTAMDVLARVIEQRFFAPPFARPEQLLLKAPAVALDVQPLPAAPPGFAGAVGQMKLTARVEPAQLRLGEAATLTVTLTGRGNVQGVGEPQVPVPTGLKIFPPQQQGEERVIGTAVQGTRTWSWVVVPESAGRATLRVPEIPYFDPQAAQYRVAAVPPIEVTTLPPAAAATDAGVLRTIRNAAAGPDSAASVFTSRRLIPWLAAVLWGIALLFVWTRRRRQVAGLPALPALPENPETNERPAYEEADRLLVNAAAESRPRQAAARIEEAWRTFLARRWDLPPTAPLPRWSELLRERGADPEAAAELGRLVDDLHYLRFAPQLSATENLTTEALSRSRRLLRRLR
jgi:hypothetical protein